MRVLVINGPNLNLLGVRRPEVYGTTTLSELEELCRGWGTALGIQVETFQSNHEGDLIDRLHAALGAAEKRTRVSARCAASPRTSSRTR